MALGSRLKAIETAVKTTIAANAGVIAAGALVTRGHPADLITDTAIWTWQVTWQESPKALSPTNPRRQDISLEIVVRCSTGGRDQEAIEDKAYDLADNVQEALRADLSLGGAADFGGITQGAVDRFMDDDGWVVAVHQTATYTARKSA